MDADQYIQASIQIHTMNTELTQTPAEGLAVIVHMMSQIMRHFILPYMHLHGPMFSCSHCPLLDKTSQSPIVHELQKS